MVNEPALRKVLEHITAHPEEWKQDQWILLKSKGSRTFQSYEQFEQSPYNCGTACCVAGHAVLNAGYIPALADSHSRITGMVYYVEKDREVFDVEGTARKELELTLDQANVLFREENSLGDLWSLAHVFTEGRVTNPEYVTKQNLYWASTQEEWL